MKKLLFTSLRVIITAMMLAWLLTQVDLESVGEVIREADPLWLILGVFVNLLSIVCAAWRWQRILVGLGFEIHILRVLRLVLSGAFFNMFLPSSVGGDVIKMVLIAPEVSRRELAISSVLMDRVVGLAVTIGVGLVAALLLPRVWTEPAVLVTLALAIVIFSAGMITVFNRRLIDFVAKLTPAFIWNKVGEPVLRIHESLMVIAHRPDILLQTSGISVLRQIAICLSIYCAGIGFGLNLAPVVYFATVPLAVAITALPVAINGLGLQDNAFIFLFATVSVASAEALSLSLYLHVLRNGVGLLGGLVFAFTRGKAATKAEEEEKSGLVVEPKPIIDK